MLVDGAWVPATPGASSSGAPKLTEAQAKDGFNAKRMVGAASTIEPLEKAGFDAGLAKSQFGPLGMMGHRREYDAAALEWADSLLRMTTGAAATKDEVKNTIRTYFPQFGDSEAVRQQKAAARQRVQQDALARAGPAAGTPPSATSGALVSRSGPQGPRVRPGGNNHSGGSSSVRGMTDAQLKAMLGL